MPTSRGDHAAWDELAAGYALDCLEPGAEEEFLRHLRGCRVCERALAEMRALAGELADAAERAGPGAARRRRPPAAWLVAAAAVLAVLVLGLWNAGLRMEADRREAVLALRRAYERMALDPDARATLTGDGGARAVALVRDGRVMVLVDGLPSSHPGPLVYVVWARDAAGRLHEVEPFEVANAGEPNLIPAMALPVPVADLAGLLVSREAGPAMPAQPGAPLLAGEVRRDG